MKATCTWQQGVYSVVHNHRNHQISLDLPPDQGGTDQGATALELVVMGLAGCIVTIFAIVAQRSKVPFSELSATIEATKDKNSPTITEVKAIVHVVSSETKEKIQRILDKTMELCPVGRLIEQAGISIPTELDFTQK